MCVARSSGEIRQMTGVPFLAYDLMRQDTPMKGDVCTAKARWDGMWRPSGQIGRKEVAKALLFILKD